MTRPRAFADLPARRGAWGSAGPLRSLVVTVVLAFGCTFGMDGPEPDDGTPNPTVRTHVVLPSTPTPAGLAYIEAIARVHADADRVSGPARVGVLRRGLAIPVPRGLGEAEILRLELATRAAEILLEAPEGAAAASEILAPLLTVDASLPLDRASARALVVLGDASARSGDDRVAAGSYARALRIMSLLRQELEP